MIYAVISFGSGDRDLSDAVKKVDPSAYTSYQQKVYFVSYKGTAESLSAEIGFTPNPPKSSSDGVVLGIHQYFGFANADLWQWMDENK